MADKSELSADALWMIDDRAGFEVVLPTCRRDCHRSEKHRVSPSAIISSPKGREIQRKVEEANFKNFWRVLLCLPQSKRT